MWFLTSENDNRVMYVVPSRQVIIGRNVDNQMCNFAIPDDPSISRKHATLTVTDESLFLEDLGSKYGTFINDSADKIEHNTTIKLNDKDVVKFGKMTSKWKVNSITLITCTSTLKGENLQNLKVTLLKLGGSLKGEWDDTCKYLTMPAITLTIKVVLALVQGSHIVTPEFWSNCLESVKNLAALPDPNEHMPEVVESTLNKEVVSFQPEDRRKKLFQDKKFVFFSKRQYEMYKPVLTKASATPLLLSECKMSMSMLCGQNIVVIQFNGGASQEVQRNQINDITAALKNKGKRVIADAEIGLAILYCSNEKYCNPSFSFTSEVVKQTATPVTINSKVLAHESQEPGLLQNKANIEINESLMSDDKSNVDLSSDKLSTKRKLGDFTSEVQLNPNKKLATSCFIANVMTDSTKRKHSDDGDKQSNPSKKMAVEKENDMSNSSDKSDDMFNFINTASSNSDSGNKTKKLNLSRPQKRKIGVNRDDGDLFNFETNEVDESENQPSNKTSIFNIQKNTEDHVDSEVKREKKTGVITPEEITAMRGIKLKELMEHTLSNNTTTLARNLKKERSEEELEEKMNGLDLCSTIVVTCNNLIVKKEPFKTEESGNVSAVLKNFKKFKKVWPVRRQTSVISSSSMGFGDSSPSIAV